MTEKPPNQSELERLFRHGKLSRRQFVAGLAALGFTGSAIELVAGSDLAPAEAQTAQARYLVLIVLDAFRADYLTMQPMASVSALARTGISYDRAWVGQLESYTPVGHATISTGSMPKTQGVIGFEWRDPATGEERLDAWSPGVLEGDMERDLRQAGVSSIPLAMKEADPHAAVAAISSEKVYAADAMGGWAADYILYGQRTSNTQLVTTGLPGHLPPQDFINHPNLKLSLPLHHFTDWDYMSAMMALAAVEELKPRVLMVNMPGTDTYGHGFGGPASPEVMKQVVAGQDRNIARIVDAYKKAGIFDQTLWVVTADHGMVPNNRTVDASVTKAAVKSAGAQYYFHTGGTAADIYLHDYWHAKKVASAMAKVSGVAAAYYLTTSNNNYEYVLAPGTKIDPNLDAAYQYLFSTFIGPSAPAVAAPFREDTIGMTFPTTHGDHGGSNWGVQQIPLVMSGPGVPAGTVSHHPARLMDVAPTVLRLMGLPPAQMDGIILADAVASATADEAALQNRVGTTLTPFQNALIQQSTDNLAEDAKLGKKPPPMKPMRP